MSKGSRKAAATQAPVYYECPGCGWLSLHPDLCDSQSRGFFVLVDDRHVATVVRERLG